MEKYYRELVGDKNFTNEIKTLKDELIEVFKKHFLKIDEENVEREQKREKEIAFFYKNKENKALFKWTKDCNKPAKNRYETVNFYVKLKEMSLKEVFHISVEYVDYTRLVSRKEKPFDKYLKEFFDIHLDKFIKIQICLYFIKKVLRIDESDKKFVVDPTRHGVRFP